MKSDRRHLVPLILQAREELLKCRVPRTMSLQEANDHLKNINRHKRDHYRKSECLRRLVMQLGISDLFVSCDIGRKPDQTTNFLVTLSRWDRHKKAVVPSRIVNIERSSIPLFAGLQKYFYETEVMLSLVALGLNLRDEFILVNEDLYQRFGEDDKPQYRKLDDWALALTDFAGAS